MSDYDDLAEERDMLVCALREIAEDRRDMYGIEAHYEAAERRKAVALNALSKATV